MLAGQIINGLVVGSMYAMVAVGFTLVLGVLDKLNFAHPEVFMFGGFVGFVVVSTGVPFWVALPAAAVVGGILGLFVEWVSFRRFTGPDGHITAALSSLAVGLILIDVTQKIWGTDPVGFSLPASISSGGIDVAGITVSYLQVIILLSTLALMAGLHFLILHTQLGRSIRAIAEAPVFASLYGINGRRVTQKTFVVSSSLAAIAGTFLSFRSGFASTEVGLVFGLKALAIMAIGGIGDMRGAVIVGLLLGVLEALAFQFGMGVLSDVAVWFAMILFLLVRPEGLFRTRTREGRA